MTRADIETTHREDVGRVPRRRGVVNGFLVVLLGLWGATVPLFGPYLGMSYGTDSPWQFTGGWFLLSLVPGVAVVLGGLGLIATAQRAGGVFWGWMAALGGAWFVLGPIVSTMWNGGQPAAGEPLAAATGVRVATDLVFHSGLGTLIVFLAAVALGRFTAGTGRTVVAAPGDHADNTNTTEVPTQDHGRHDAEKLRRDPADRSNHEGVYAQGARTDANGYGTAGDGTVRHGAPREDTYRDSSHRDNTFRDGTVGDTPVRDNSLRDNPVRDNGVPGDHHHTRGPGMTNR
ncbi:hypothetical protein ACTG9Q_25335 [Actinokineospora sp. 24-640]